MNTKGTREQRRETFGKAFIEKAQNLYGNKYDYTLVDYHYSSQKVKIGCREHGVWLQRQKEECVRS